MYFVFFFSSRRRHTRLQGDWSSDVCSSDLSDRAGQERRSGQGRSAVVRDAAAGAVDTGLRRVDPPWASHLQAKATVQDLQRARSEERRVGKEGRTGCSQMSAKNRKGRTHTL